MDPDWSGKILWIKQGRGNGYQIPMVELAMDTKEKAKRIRTGYVGKKKGGVDIGKLFLGCRLHLTRVLELNKVNSYV